jgi:peptide/nickel transport system permease protein
MTRYVGRRLLHGLFLLAGVSVLTFLFLDLAPGDFFDQMRLNPEMSAQTVATLRAQYGLDRRLPVRYARWMRSVLRGEWGFSFAYNSPAAPLLWARAQNTLLLGGTATLLAWLIAIPLGVWIASRPGGWTDRLGSAGTSLLLAVPDLVLALGLLWFALRTGVFPTGGMASLDSSELGAWARVKDVAWHLFLPVCVLVLAVLPLLVRHVRSAMAEVLDSPFILAARARGIPRRRLLFRYALPAASNSLISLFGLSVAGLLSGSLLVEVVMSWPGLGPLLLEAVLARDVYLVVGAVMFSTVFLVAGNLLADLLLYAADPRIRIANP